MLVVDPSGIEKPHRDHVVPYDVIPIGIPIGNVLRSYDMIPIRNLPRTYDMKSHRDFHRAYDILKYDGLFHDTAMIIAIE